MKRLVIVSDMHVGSKVAVAPPEARIGGQENLRPTKRQKLLYDFWAELAKKWNRPDFLVINGEPFDGNGRLDYSTGEWSADMNDQMSAAKTLIDMYDARKIYLTHGSGYHVDRYGTNDEETFARMIGAQETAGSFAPWIWDLKIDEVTFNFAHHIGVAANIMYRSTPLNREMAMAKLNEHHLNDSDVFVRSHVHTAWATRSPSKLTLTTPCWQAATGYMMKKGPVTMIPDFGATVFDVEGDSYSWDWVTRKFEAMKPPLVKV